MPIIKTLSKATKAERDKFRIPRSVQDAIPIRRIWSDGIFQVGTQFSKTFWSDTIKPHTQGGIMKNRKGVEDGTEIQCRIQGRRAEIS